MITLGIETSCDETALALIETGSSDSGETECRVISSLVHSQADLHSAYGGVYPSLAKREHGKNLIPLLEKLMAQLLKDGGASVHDDKKRELDTDEFEAIIGSFKQELERSNPDLFYSLKEASFLKNVPPIDRIAVTEGPGLEPALWVGINFAKIISSLWKIPIVPVNHMEGHIIGSLLEDKTPYGVWQKLKRPALPAIALLISGGHTELIKICLGKTSPFDYQIIGQTRDDAVGEAFDKVARLLGLPYPGGPHISELSKKAEVEAIVSPVKLPRPMIMSGDLDFSFSGLKTAVLYAIGKNQATKEDLPINLKKGIAHEFELAVAETLDSKLRSAIEKIGAKTIIIGGGVSANHMLRERFQSTAEEYGLPIYLPREDVSGDNALMIALAGALDGKTTENLKANGTKRLGTSLPL